MKRPEYKKYIFAYVTEELHQEVREFCVKRKTTIVALMTRLLKEEMKKEVK